MKDDAAWVGTWTYVFSESRGNSSGSLTVHNRWAIPPAMDTADQRHRSRHDLRVCLVDVDQPSIFRQ